MLSIFPISISLSSLLCLASLSVDLPHLQKHKRVFQKKKIMLYFQFAERACKSDIVMSKIIVHHNRIADLKTKINKAMFRSKRNVLFFNHLTLDLKSNFHSSILPIVPGSTVVVENVRLEII